MGATKLPSEWLCCESLPVLGYVGVESAQSSSFGPSSPPPTKNCFLRPAKSRCQNQTMLVATDNSTVLAYINKQGETYLADMCTYLEIHDLVLSLQNNPTGQAHSRVPECDGQCTVQVEKDQINKMITIRRYSNRFVKSGSLLMKNFLQLV